MPSPRVNIEQACQIAGCSRRTMHWRMQKGLVAFERTDGKVWILRDSIAPNHRRPREEQADGGS